MLDKICLAEGERAQQHEVIDHDGPRSMEKYCQVAADAPTIGDGVAHSCSCGPIAAYWSNGPSSVDKRFFMDEG